MQPGLRMMTQSEFESLREGDLVYVAFGGDRIKVTKCRIAWVEISAGYVAVVVDTMDGTHTRAGCISRHNVLAGKIAESEG